MKELLKIFPKNNVRSRVKCVVSFKLNVLYCLVTDSYMAKSIFIMTRADKLHYSD